MDTIYFLMDNRIFCTFTPEEMIGTTIDLVRSRYTVMFKKLFILATDSNSEYLITYNLEPNISIFPSNTILVHRRKATNTLYTINALNRVISKATGGKIDKNYSIDWEKYRNSLLLIRNSEFAKINTKLYKIVEW